MAQAREVQEAMVARGWQTELVPMPTRGDLILDRALDQVGGKGIFTTELEQALLAGELDCAVHSLKDLPTEGGHEGSALTIAAYTSRADARDVLIAGASISSLEQVPRAGKIGTSSIRRRLFMEKLRPDLEIVPVRGKIATRLRKMEESSWFGLVLAAAGLERLGLGARIACYLDPLIFVPAPGQGILAVQVRRDDEHAMEAVKGAVNDPQSAVCALAERAVLEVLGGGCQIPLGAYAIWTDANDIWLSAKMVDVHGQEVTGEIRGHYREAKNLGRALGRQLGERGGHAVAAGRE